MLNVHFSPDTYDCWTTSDNNVDVHLRDGRFITAAIYQILSGLNINVAKNQTIFTLIFMITFVVLITILRNIVDFLEDIGCEFYFIYGNSLL